eukprot:3356811-Amphidinium_carterae.1
MQEVVHSQGFPPTYPPKSVSSQNMRTLLSFPLVFCCAYSLNLLSFGISVVWAFVGESSWLLRSNCMTMQLTLVQCDARKQQEGNVGRKARLLYANIKD